MPFMWLRARKEERIGEILILEGVWGVWVMVGVQGKVAFGLSHFCIEVFQKKF